MPLVQEHVLYQHPNEILLQKLLTILIKHNAETSQEQDLMG